MPRDGSPTDGENPREPTPDSDANATPALVAARASGAAPDTTEIAELAAAAGYDVIGTVTQRGRADPTYGLGRGKAEELMRLAVDTDAEAVIYDGELSPGQTFSLGDLLPARTVVIDRPRLLLRLFAAAADSRAARLQSELARLRYELPRLREVVARDASERVRLRPEDDGRVLDVERRIESTERALKDVVDDRAARRAERREAGFDLVAVAGYADAGKSTLARRLADDVPDAGTRETDAAAEPSRLVDAVTTTARRSTLGGRRLIVTDTVGFVDGLPKAAVRSFQATLDAVRTADCTLLVVDASDDPATVARTLRASLTAFDRTNGPVIPVLNKIDRLDAEAVDARVDAFAATVDELAADGVPIAADLAEPVAASGRTGAGVDELGKTIAAALPTTSATVETANSGETQAAISWGYDREVVESVEYAGDSVRVALAGRPAVVAEARRRLGEDV